MKDNKYEANQCWKEYQSILSFMKQDGVFENTKVNERMYAGDQWFHITKENKLPRIVLNFIKRTVNFLVSAIHGGEIKIKYTAQPYLEDDDEVIKQYEEAADLFTSYAETAMEDMQMTDLNEQMIKDSLLSGLGLIHFYWDDDVITGNGIVNKGEVKGEILDSTNFFPLDPTLANIQAQQRNYITSREDVDVIKRIAKEEGLPPEKIAMITPDSDTSEQSFDKAQNEVDGSKKATVLTCYYKEDGVVWFQKQTKSVVFEKPKSTKKTLFPIIGMNGEIRKRSIYGTAPITEVVPNQIYVNTLYSMAMVSTQRTAYPKALYDATKISGVSNGVGGAIGVNGDITNTFRYTQTGQVSTDVYNLVNDVVSKTKENQGANDAALGNVKPENTSAMMFSAQQSNIPLQTIERRFYKSQEDFGRILAEFWKVNYVTARAITINGDEGKAEFVEFDAEKYQDIEFNVKIDVGAASQYSEIISINTLNEWLAGGHIDFVELLERFPKAIVPKIQDLIEPRKEAEQMEEMNMFLQQQSPAIQQYIMGLPEEQMKSAIEQLMEMSAEELQGLEMQLNQAVM